MKALQGASAALVGACILAAPGRPVCAAGQTPGSERAGASTPGAAGPSIPPVRVDAIVTDPRGRRVLDLGAQDFEVKADGAIQSVRVELRKNPAARVFAFYLDEFHVSPGAASERTREAVTRFIDQKLRPGDLALVVKPLQQVAGATLTADRDALKAAAASFDGRKGDYSARTRFEELYIGRAPAAVSAARAQIVTVALTELALRLGELEVDRAVIVLVSEGFDRPGPSRRRVGDVQGLVRAASRLHLALYAISPVAGAADPAAGPAVATLRWLATQTGGEVMLEPERMPEALDRVGADLDAYYALTFEPKVTDGRFHPIEVRAMRAGLQVRARPGYWAPLESEWRAWLARPSTAPSAPRRELRRSPLIETWVGVAPGASGGPDVILSWEPSPRGASVRLPESVLVQARSRGVVLFDGPLASARGTGPGRSLRFAAGPGRVEIDLTIANPDGTLLDVERRDVDVPDLQHAKPGPLLLPTAIVRARSAREFRAVDADLDSPPTASRRFSRGDRLLIRAPAWDVTGVPVAITARVLNVRGQPMRDIERVSGSEEGAAVFDLPLAWLAPGEYEIEITGRNANGAAAQRILFTLSR